MMERRGCGWVVEAKDGGRGADWRRRWEGEDEKPEWVVIGAGGREGKMDEWMGMKGDWMVWLSWR